MPFFALNDAENVFSEVFGGGLLFVELVIRVASGVSCVLLGLVVGRLEVLGRLLERESAMIHN